MNRLDRWLLRARRLFITFAPVKSMIRKSKKIILPGFRGIPLFDVVNFFFAELKKEGLNERASSIAFNLLMAIPSALIFLLTLIPYMPISNQFTDQLFGLIRDIMPGEKNNHAIILFLVDLMENPRHGLLSLGFLLALFYSSNAMLGIMRSFDKSYIGFKKRSSMQERKTALKLILIVFILLIIGIGLLIAQGTVLKWIIKSSLLRAIITNFRWILIVLLFLSINSFIYKFAPAVHKKWKLLNPGSILATFLMIVTTLIFSYYVTNFNSYNTLYGSIGTILILMLLIYFNALVLLIGFELNVSISSLKRIADDRKEAEETKNEAETAA
jgi:membrane protein